jgi:SAM-dependent methyltransferase
MKNHQIITTIKCPICNSVGKGYKVVYGYSSFICTECSHIYVENHNSDSLLNLYNYDFYDKYMQVGYHNAYNLYFKNDFERKVELIKKYVAPGSTILEVGCGPGYFADLLQKEGYLVTGVELNTACKAYAKNHNVRFDNFVCKDITNSNMQYDAVVSWATIEHVRKPLNFVNTLKEHTKINGYVFIDTGVTNKIIRMLDCGYTKWLQPPHHLHVFSNDSLMKVGTLNQLSPVVFYSWFNSSGKRGKIFRSLIIFIKIILSLGSVFRKKNQGCVAKIGLIVFIRNKL